MSQVRVSLLVKLIVWRKGPQFDRYLLYTQLLLQVALKSLIVRDPSCACFGLFREDISL